MKLTINIKTKNVQLPYIIKKGDWIDLTTAEDIVLEGPTSGVRHRKMNKGVTTTTRPVTINNKLINLGVAMQLPEGFEAYVLPRSSTFNKWGVILANSMGIIDNSYQGDNDEWLFNAIALKSTTIPAGTPIAQFRIQLSQKATFLQKLKWLFSTGIKLNKVTNLIAANRGGFGTTYKTDN